MLFLGAIPHFLSSSFRPRLRQGRPIAIPIYVPDPERAQQWLTKNQFDADPEFPLHVIDSQTGLMVRLMRGCML